MNFQTSPLANIRILDLSRLLPGPYATRLLADLGAEIIKIETPLLGDYARKTPPALGGLEMFEMLNRGKKCVAINYRNQEGRDIFLKLAETADVIIETFKPGSVNKWGIGYEAASAHNPRIIYCSLSGYGQSGPYATRLGHDLNYIAIGGLLNLNGSKDSAPALPGVQIADLSGATFAAFNILAALIARHETSKGRHLDVAMLDPIIHWTLSIAGSGYFGTGEIPERGTMPLAGGWPCYNVYAAADLRHLALGALEPPFWAEFCRVIERNDLLKEGYNPKIIPTIAEILRQKSADEWLKMFDETDCPLDLVLTLPETLRHPQIVYRGFGRLDSTTASRDISQKAAPLPYPAEDGQFLALGQDTRAVLESIGYSTEEIQQFTDKGIIKVAK